MKKIPFEMNEFIEFISTLDPFKSTIDEFLSSLLRELMKVVPKADCGSVFTYKNGKVRFVDAVCHDLEALKNLELDESDFKLPKNEVFLVKNTLELHSPEVKKKFAGAIKPLKESLVFDLKIDGKNVAGMGIDILKGSEDHFDKRSIMIVKLFKNLASNAFKIKTLEEELSKSNTRFKVLSEFSPVGIALINTSFEFSYVNRMACEMSEYSKDELLKMHFWEVVHPDFVDMVKERGMKRLKGVRAIKEYSIKIITKSGKEKWIDLRSKKTELFGKPMLIISASDVDELKKIQESRDRAMQRYKLALKASRISAFEYEIPQKTLKISKEIFTQLGYDFGAFNDSMEKFREFVHPDDFKKVFESLPRYVKGESSKFDVEYRMRTSNGEWQWIATRGKIIKMDEKGDPITIFGIVENVNEKKQIEEKLREYATYDDLTGVYNRRTGLAILSEKMKSSARSGEPLSICFVDINDLKHVNDKFGHKSGDDLIKTSVRLMLKNIRKSDVLSRMGGDEFLLIFPSCTLENSEKRWEKVKLDLERENSAGKQPYNIILSHGCAQYDYISSQDEFIAQADIKMYEEKKSIKSSSHFDLFR